MVPVRLPYAWRVYAGDPFSTQIILEDQASGIASRTWTAEARALLSTEPPMTEPETRVLAGFTVIAAEGTGTEVGNVLLTLSLSAAQTAALPNSCYARLRQHLAGSESTTLVRVIVNTIREAE